MDLSWPAEYVPLALLEQSPCHGYDLHRTIGGDPVLRSIWRLGRSELYFLLKKLEKRGWILPQASEVVLGPRRTTYVITPAGRAAVHAWLATPVPNPRDLRAEFLAKVYLGRLTGAPETAELLDGQRHVLEERLERLTAGARRTGFVRHVYSLRTLQTQAALQWLTDLEASDPSAPDRGSDGLQVAGRTDRVKAQGLTAPGDGSPGADPR